MKTQLLFISFLLIGTLAFAQQDTTLIYANPGYNKDPLRANWRKEVAHKDSLWVVSMYNKKDELKERISYGDERLEIRKGPYAFYENGKLKESGDFDKGYKYGEWKTFFPNEQVHEKTNYAWGNLHGSYRLYWDNGHLKKEGRYSRGKKVGNWRMFYKDGKPALKESYDDKGTLVDSAYFDMEGKSVNSIAVQQAPSFPRGMANLYRVFGREVRYPGTLAREGVQGTVKLSFLVTKEGKITDITVVESPHVKLSNEAIRVLKLTSGAWIPAMELGEAADAQFILPVKFSIGR